MFTVPEADLQQTPEMLEGDSEFLEQFKQEVNTDGADEFISAYNAVTGGI